MKFNIPKAERIKYSSFVKRTGKLEDFFIPAAFCDTSFLVDYADSASLNPMIKGLPWNQEYPETVLFKEYLKSEQRTKKIYRIREILENYENKVQLVYSPACRLELEEVLTERSFKNSGVGALDIKSILRKGRKEIGDIIEKIMRDSMAKGASNEQINLYHAFFLLTADSEMFIGLWEADLVNIKITKKDFYKIGFLANLQIGFADIFHLISASKLGCKYFFTFDHDYTRASTEIKSIFDIQVVTEIDKMIDIIIRK